MGTLLLSDLLSGRDFARDLNFSIKCENSLKLSNFFLFLFNRKKIFFFKNQTQLNELNE